MSEQEAWNWNALIDEIERGWKAQIIDHDHLTDSQDDIAVTAVEDGHLVLTPVKAWSSQGRKYPSMLFTWEGDMEVDGRRVRVYHTPEPYTGKPRRMIKTFIFSPPSA